MSEGRPYYGDWGQQGSFAVRGDSTVMTGLRRPGFLQSGQEEETVTLYPPWALFPGALTAVQSTTQPETASFPKAVEDPVCWGKRCSWGSTVGGWLGSACPSWGAAGSAR